MYWAYRKEGFKCLEVADNVSFSLYQIPTTPSQHTLYTNTGTCLLSNRLSINAYGMNGQIDDGSSEMYAQNNFCNKQILVEMLTTFS